MFGYEYSRIDRRGFYVWNLKMSSLKNFYARAKDVLNKKFHWDMREDLAPKKLSVILYVQMMREHRARIENALEIRRMREIIQKQREEITRLEDIEKNIVYARYFARLYRYMWHCGDGCCSETECYLVVFDENGNVVQRPASEGTYHYEHLIKEAKEKFGSSLEIHMDNDVNEKYEIPGY